ncbi:MAG: SGNH/GDSL hydrolase family protein [Clostridia bacterium]|nr:SGNH/GDSL hydrolase family protein [Clostridia bacterium]
MKNIDYKDYVIEAPLNKEGIEWSHNYTYNANDQESPRVLMIGDSICNGYQWKVRELLANRVNISFFITSYCVTRERYLRMLDMILEDSRYDLVLFNSGHLANAIPLWEKSFRSAIDFIGDKLEGVKLALVKSVPHRLERYCAENIERNGIIDVIAAEKGLSVIDLWTPMEALGKGDDVFRDNAHFVRPVEEKQGAIVSNAICELLDIREDGKVVQVGNELGPAGAIQ